jgi:hypothetical protein
MGRRGPDDENKGGQDLVRGGGLSVSIKVRWGATIEALGSWRLGVGLPTWLVRPCMTARSYWHTLVSSLNSFYRSKITRVSLSSGGISGQP